MSRIGIDTEKAMVEIMERMDEEYGHLITSFRERAWSSFTAEETIPLLIQMAVGIPMLVAEEVTRIIEKNNELVEEDLTALGQNLERLQEKPGFLDPQLVQRYLQLIFRLAPQRKDALLRRLHLEDIVKKERLAEFENAALREESSDKDE